MFQKENYHVNCISVALIFLGIPFNIASYSLLTMMVADQVGLKYGDFIHTLGDAHLYENHIKQAEVQIQRSPKNLPEMKLIRAYLLYLIINMMILSSIIMMLMNI